MSHLIDEIMFLELIFFFFQEMVGFIMGLDIVFPLSFAFVFL